MAENLWSVFSQRVAMRRNALIFSTRWRQDSAIQDWPPFSSLESDLESEGNPLR
jgi:hypothetical protein